MSNTVIFLIIDILMIAAGCYGLIKTRHMLKIIIATEVASKATTLFLSLQVI